MLALSQCVFVYVHVHMCVHICVSDVGTYRCGGKRLTSSVFPQNV